MINKSKKILFIHIPKTGGTSVEKYIDPNSPIQDHRPLSLILKEESLINRLKYSSFKRQLKRLAYKLHPKFPHSHYLTLSKEDLKNYICFTIVRDPWTRTLSGYKNVMRDQKHKNSLGITTKINFEQFLRRYNDTFFLKSQLYWLYNQHQEIPEEIKIINFDDFYTEVPKLLKPILGDKDFPHYQRSETKKKLEDLNNTNINLISEYFKEEIDYFNFSPPISN